MGGNHDCRGRPRRLRSATQRDPGPVGIALAGTANDPSPGRSTAEPLGPVARLRRSTADQHVAGEAPHAPLLPCLGHGPHPVPRPRQPVHAAARPRAASDGHFLFAVGRDDRASGGLFRMEQHSTLGHRQRRREHLPLVLHRRTGLHPGAEAVRRLLSGPAADDARSGPRSHIHAGDGQGRLPTAAGGDRLPPEG